MAKKSAIKKNETRIKKVSLMGKKRKALKDIIMNRELPLDERRDDLARGGPRSGTGHRRESTRPRETRRSGTPTVGLRRAA